MEPLVAHSEREWILIGIAESCAAKGFEKTTVADVCAAAGVSTESFDRAFTDKEECLGAAMESLVEEAWRRLSELPAAGGQWAERLREAAAVLLGLLAERPAFAHLALIEAPVAEGRAATLYRSTKAALLDFVERGREHGRHDVPPSAARGALAGAEALVAGRVLAGKTERLAELEPDVVYLLAVPYLGRGEARRLARGPAKRGHLRAVA
jgi:AcrR family transcriptional regulator